MAAPRAPSESVWQRLSTITDREVATEDFLSEEHDSIDKQLVLQVCTLP